jgi:hypothetical protein
MNKVLTCLCILVLSHCNTPDHPVSDYISRDQSQIILKQAVRYMYYAEGIPEGARFDSTYDAKYNRVLRDFYFARYYFADPNDEHIFLMVRKYAGEKFRATGGKLKVDSSYKVLHFEEIFVTPLSDETDVLNKGEFLFRQIVEKGSVDHKYFAMKSYVEWPDEHTEYDTLRHQWVRGR